MADQDIPEDFATLFVTNLPDDEEAVRNEFSKYGEISNFRFLPKKDDQDTRAGVITMSTGAQAREVMLKLKGGQLDPGGKRLRFTWDTRALERFKGDGRSGGNSGGGGFGGGFGGSFGGSSSFNKGNVANASGAAITPLGAQTNQSGDAVMNVIRSGESIKVDGQEYVPLRVIMNGKQSIAGFVLTSLYSVFEKSQIVTKPSDVASPSEERPSRFDSTALADSVHPPDASFQRSDSGVASTTVSPVAVRQSPVVDSPTQTETLPLKVDEELPDFAGVMRRRKSQFGVATSTSSVSSFLPPTENSSSLRVPKKLSLRSLSAFTPGVLTHPGSKTLVTEKQDFFVCVRHIFSNFEAAVWTAEKGKDNSEPLAFVASMSRRLKDFYDGFDARQFPVEPNQPVAVCIDGIWYRAKCTAEKSPTDLVVFLVDEGTEREGKQDATFPLDEQFGREPVNAVTVGLTNLPTLEQHPNLLEELRDLFQGSSDAVTALIVLRTPEYQVRLWIEDVSLKIILLSRRLRNSGHEVSIGFVLNAADAVNVFVVDVSKKEELVNLQSKVNEVLSTSQIPPVSVERDSSVGVFYEGEWYRGLVDKVKGGICQGTLLDFGDAFTVPIAKLKSLPEEVAAIPPVTDMSALKNVPAQLLADARITEQLQKLVGHYWVYEELGRDSLFPVANFIHLWNEEGEMVPLNMPPVPLLPKSIVINEDYNFYVTQLKYEREFKQGDEIPVSVQYVSDPEFVYLLHGKDLQSDERLLQLASDLQSAGQTAPRLVDMPAEGALVIGRFSVDGAWYRAAITGFSLSGKAQVTYIDYGNEEELSLEDMRSMTPLLMTYPRMVFQAGLGNIQPLNGEQFSAEETQRATALLGGQFGTFKVLMNNDDSLMLGVLRMEDNRSAADLMAEAGIIKKVK